jgi:hypothetical protein
MKEFVLDASGQQRLREYFDRIGGALGTPGNPENIDTHCLVDA